MLSKASWLHYAEGLPLGGSVRVDHDCGGGRTLTVKHRAEGLSAFCFRCNDSGWVPPPERSLSERLASLAAKTTEDNKIAGSVALPEPMVKVWADWPVSSRVWLLKAGLCSADLPRLGAYYHPPSDRVVLPVLSSFGQVLFWQARATDKRLPKYMAPPVDKTSVVPVYGRANEVTLTEDILSAYKVGLVGEGWSLLGTSISKTVLGNLVKRNCKVNVWLDPDAAGIRAATKVCAALRSAGLEARNIKSRADPKLLSRAEIKELLCSQ